MVGDSSIVYASSLGPLFNGKNALAHYCPSTEIYNKYLLKNKENVHYIHLVTTARNNGHMFSSSAPGVLMGVGNVGEYLLPYEQCDTFLSYDGGLTWKVVKLGAHMFGIGHYGSILVIVDDEQPTYHILYSYDRGEHWYA